MFESDWKTFWAFFSSKAWPFEKLLSGFGSLLCGLQHGRWQEGGRGGGGLWPILLYFHFSVLRHPVSPPTAVPDTTNQRYKCQHRRKSGKSLKFLASLPFVTSAPLSLFPPSLGSLCYFFVIFSDFVLFCTIWYFLEEKTC